ncbi:two component transcriptional regulator, LuxR family [Variovorax sp. OK605]|nr:two component transcriptional regulator, LuxR family [Variovorax sp. OK605]
MLADENIAVRRAIASELVLDPRVCVAGEAASIQEAKRLLAHNPVDVLILDVRMGGGKGFELIESAKRDGAAREVIVHSALEDADTVRRAFSLGASGYLVKNCWFLDFARSVLQVANGGAAVSPSLARRMLLRANRDDRELHANAASRRTLSRRECEVLRLVAMGHVTQDIARRLSISAQTVGSHMKNICSKLQVHTRAHAVIAATKLGFL